MHDRAPEPPRVNSSVLSPPQIAALYALADRLVPPDADTPGGAAGGAFAYVVRELEDGGNLAAFRGAYRELLDVLDAAGFAGGDPAAQDDLLRRLEQDGRAPARRALLLAAEHAQEGYYTEPANWPSLGYIVTG